MPMKVYVVVHSERYSTSVGDVYHSLKEAMDANEAEWSREGHYVTHWDRVVAEAPENEEGFAPLIYERELHG